MGFLPHGTNNVILDATLTDTGRAFLAKNDGSFSIVKFAVGDDEVDYTLIKQFGRTVGKEKIEKNTPPFQALTNAAFALKNRCVSLSNPNLIRLPSLALAGVGVNSTTNVVSIGTTTTRTRQLAVQQTIGGGETTIDVELRDQAFVLELDNRFLQVLSRAPDNVDAQQRATYILSRDTTETSVGGSQVTFTVGVKAITESQFQVYGAKYNKNLISTFVRVSGLQSGTVLEFEVQINKLS
ncbi:MAG: hypothetical protein E6R04_02655 [Spirochaetes bacterium]|nr:MAG: hypothetical protein E6R04_02655 [Spirochaetota bacterium]